MALKLLCQSLTKTKTTIVIHYFSTTAVVASPPKYENPTGITMKSVKIVGHPLYLDMQGTFLVDLRILDSMFSFYLSRYSNPQSHTYFYGWELKIATKSTRLQIGTLIGAFPKKIVYFRCHGIEQHLNEKRHAFLQRQETPCHDDANEAQMHFGFLPASSTRRF
ncbi:cysteine desulfurase, mitochondrial-like [Durio zibethinus]|uniref:Cysteine desulfurase, mitochondrial-like n=1 Tax=Durio zibethinus TaxID=66656 RepID=A0A6P5WZ17_DURZI|nr:cysteine desulfurase, mitochondrial-like [Durio zibethinus]